MRSGGWKSFWTAFWVTMLVLVPLVGGTVLLGQRQARQRVRSAAESQSGVPVAAPKAEDRLAALVCVSGEEPGFVLLYLNADQNSLGLLAVPGESAVPFGEGEAALRDCYAAAGPARCVQGLNAALGVEIERYIALSPETLAKAVEDLGPLRVGFSGVLTAQELAACGQTEAVQDWAAGPAHAFLTGAQESPALRPQKCAALRAAVWEAFFRQKLEQLPAALPAALRKYSSTLLTDLTAGDLYILEETLEFLANNAAAVDSGALPGEWDGAAGLYRLDDGSCAAAQALFDGALGVLLENAAARSAPLASGQPAGPDDSLPLDASSTVSDAMPQPSPSHQAGPEGAAAASPSASIAAAQAAASASPTEAQSGSASAP